MIQVYKFGGASIKTADTARKIRSIITKCDKLIIVVSAIDKTTNALEKLFNSYFYSTGDKNTIFNKIERFHINFYKDLLQEEVSKEFSIILSNLQTKINSQAGYDANAEYDDIVVYGELLSSRILYEFLRKHCIDIGFLDIRDVLITDDTHKEGKVDWEISGNRIKNYLLNNKENKFITQGFIARSKTGNNISLGREGSDFTAAALAYMIDARSVTIWKDVPGIMNADPAKCSFAEKIDLLSYQEAIELAFYGAKVIHPKTIKPLENKNIPLYVKSFANPDLEGTVIRKVDYKLKLVPIYILKDFQMLISVSPKDFSFIVEENISKIFNLVVKYRIKVNMTQNSAISFSAAIDCDFGNISGFIQELSKEYKLRYNENLQLVTIRHSTDEAIEKMTGGKKVFMEQRSRNTARFLISGLD